LVVLHSLTESEDGVLAIEQCLLDKGHQPVRLTGASTSAYRSPLVRYYKKVSIRGLWAFARSGLLFSSHAFFGGLSKARGQQNVLLWHGEVVKPVGALHNDRAIAADVAPVCSEIGQRYRCSEFRLGTDQVPVIGAPRNDRMLRTDRQAVRQALGWASDEAVWLWLPTYRGPVSGGRGGDRVSPAHSFLFDDSSVAMLDSQLVQRKITLVLKPHPLAAIDIADGHHGLRLMRQSEIERSGISLYQMLAAADGLVTDASSVWIDFLLTQRPIIFAFPDIAEYRKRRGLNLEPYEEWAPGPFVYDLQSLGQRLTGFRDGQDPFGDRRSDMLGRFHLYTDDDSSSRLLNLLGL
jgi:hypothetical protein